MQNVKFDNTKSPEFLIEVRNRVFAYFKENQLSMKADRSMLFKSGIFVAITIATYSLLLIKGNHLVVSLLCYSILGFCFALLGFNIAHDAAHNAYSNEMRINQALSYIFDFGGFSSHIWKVTHNILHHTYTNIPNVDKDISNFPLFRYAPSEKYCWYHAFQYIYAVFLYCLVGLARLVFKDFKFFYNQKALKKTVWRPFLMALLFKIVHVAVLLLVPMYLLPLPWQQILGCYLCTSFIGSVTLAVVVSLAHVNTNVEILDLCEGENYSVNDHWAIHEMKTTANFAMNSRLWTFLLGGLNYQIEHHLFPQICHIHYPKIAPMIQQIARELGVPYHTISTFFGAIRSHLSLLKRMGQMITPK